MRTRDVFNVIGFGFGAFPGFLFVLHRAVSLFGDGQAAADLVGLVDDVPVNWPVAYVLLFSLSASLLVVNNWKWLVRWFAIRREERRRTWNQTAVDAVTYIESGSHFGKSLPDDKGATLAFAAFKEAAEARRLDVVGRRGSGATLEQIVKADFVRYTLTPKYTHTGLGVSRLRLYEVTLNNGKEIVVAGLMVDRDQVIHHWPPAPSSRY